MQRARLPSCAAAREYRRDSGPQHLRTARADSRGFPSLAVERLRKPCGKSAAKAARGRARTPKAYAEKNSLDVFRVKRLWSAMRPRIAFLFRASAAFLFSLRASAQRDHRRRQTGPIN